MKTINYAITLSLITLAQFSFAQHTNDKARALKTTTQVLLDQILSENDLKDNNMFRMETVTFPPAYSSVKHTHPCPLFVYVLEGELLSEFEGVKKVYQAGDTFYERPTGVHSITRNNSATSQAKILVIYLMKEGINTFNPTEH